jgi:hypothetical protein
MIEIPESCRVRNTLTPFGGSCLWQCFETCARYLGIRALNGITSNSNGPARISTVQQAARRLGVKIIATENVNAEWLKGWLNQNVPVVIGFDDFDGRGEGHAVILAGLDDFAALIVNDNRDMLVPAGGLMQRLSRYAGVVLPPLRPVQPEPQGVQRSKRKFRRKSPNRWHPSTRTKLKAVLDQNAARYRARHQPKPRFTREERRVINAQMPVALPSGYWRELQ